MTTDLIDVLDELEKIPDGGTISITKEEMTLPEFESEIKKRGILNMTIKTPWKDGSE